MQRMDIALIISFVLSYMHVLLLNLVYVMLTYVNDGVLCVLSPLWIVSKTDDNDGYMTDDDFVLHGRNEYIVSMFGKPVLEDNAISCTPHCGVKPGSVFINMAMIVDVVVDRVDISKYELININTITNKLRCLLYVRGCLTLPDICNITEEVGNYIVIIYNSYEGRQMKQIINIKQRKEILTGKDIMFGMLIL